MSLAVPGGTVFEIIPGSYSERTVPSGGRARLRRESVWGSRLLREQLPPYSQAQHRGSPTLGRCPRGQHRSCSPAPTLHFCAMHESAFGTSRTLRTRGQLAALWGKADVPRLGFRLPNLVPDSVVALQHRTGVRRPRCKVGSQSGNEFDSQ